MSDDTQTSKEEDRFFSNELDDELDLGLEPETEEPETEEESDDEDDPETDESSRNR